MSFILDALKKSETDRQRQNGPALFEVKVAPPRSGLPLWAIGLGVLLAVNLIIVAWVLLRRPAQAETAGTQGSFQGAADGRGGGQSGQGGGGQGAGGGQAWRGGGPAGQGQGGQAWQGSAGAQGGQGGSGPAGQGQAWQGGGQDQGGQAWQGGSQGGQGQGGQAWQGGAGGQGGGPAGQGQAWQGGGQSGPAGQGQGGQGGGPAGQGQAWQGSSQGQGGQQRWPGQQSGQAGYGPPGTAAVNGTAPTGPLAQAAGPTTPGGFNGAGDTGERLSADDTAPAAEAPSAAPFGNHVSRATSSGVPLYQDAAVQPGAHIPELRLDLHVFAAQPQERFVMINMHKLHEGDSLPEGVRVESITPEGAVLSKDGLRFLLTRQ